MGKVSKKDLINLIENLVNRLVENKVEEIVEERVQKLTPMLVEHEVNRILRENDVSMNTNNSNNNSVVQNTSNRDKPIDEIEGKGQLRERFKALVGGDVSTDGQGNNTVSMNSNNVTRTAPQTTPDGKPVDMNNENVQRVANVMNQDFSDTLKKLEENSKKRNGKLG